MAQTTPTLAKETENYFNRPVEAAEDLRECLIQVTEETDNHPQPTKLTHALPSPANAIITSYATIFVTVMFEAFPPSSPTATLSLSLSHSVNHPPNHQTTNNSTILSCLPPLRAPPGLCWVGYLTVSTGWWLQSPTLSVTGAGNHQPTTISGPRGLGTA